MDNQYSLIEQVYRIGYKRTVRELTNVYFSYSKR